MNITPAWFLGTGMAIVSFPVAGLNQTSVDGNGDEQPRELPRSRPL